jgi:hypothetical protein
LLDAGRVPWLLRKQRQVIGVVLHVEHDDVGKASLSQVASVADAEPLGNPRREPLDDRLRHFYGVFCMNDLCGLGAIEATEKAGRRVGKDIAVMGIDNLEMSGVSRISLTSIDQPYDRIIELAARAMISSIEKNEPCTIRRRLKPSLVVRGSTSLAGAPVAG